MAPCRGTAASTHADGHQNPNDCYIFGRLCTRAARGREARRADLRLCGPSTDTPTTVAAALAALVPGATASGAVLTVPVAPDFLVRTGGQVLVQREVRRQVQGFQITLWCPNQASRDAATSLVDQGLAETDWIRLPDAAWGRLLYVSSSSDDVPTKEALWKRSLIFTVEYGTTQTKSVQTMLFGGIQISVKDAETSTTYY